MKPQWRRPVVGVLVAIVITTAMDASGLSAFSALPLFPLLAVFWYWEKLSRVEVGFVWGRIRHYALALLHPVLVLGLLVVIAWLMGAVNLGVTDWQKTWLNVALVGLSTTLIVIITEEGFFRGWLWASLSRVRPSPGWVLVWSSLAFAAWHLSAVLLETGFNPPLAQVPVYIVNAVVLGAVWGMLRMLSGSVLVASVGHGVWNGLAYVLFGFGERVGAFGIQATGIYGPEVGVLGLVLNALFAVILWQWLKGKQGETRQIPAPVQR